MSSPTGSARFALLLVALLAVEARAQTRAAARTPQQLVARAVEAMGGEAALRALANTTVEFNTAVFGIGQEETPASPPRATFSFGRVVTDYRGGRRQIVQEARAVTGVVTRTRRIVNATMGMTETNGTLAPDGGGAVAAAATEIRALPDRVLLAALDNAGSLQAVAPKRWRGETMDGVRVGPDAGAATLWFDRLNGRLVVIERLTDDGVLGDRATASIYTRWQEAGAVSLPRELDIEANGRLVNHTVYTTVTTNASLAEADFAIPDSIARRAQPLPGAQPPITVTLNELGPNVWRAEGGSHHSLVIRQPNGLVIVEMPQSSARSKAVLDTLRSRFPGVAIRQGITTHHHWDHSGGVREYLAQNIPVVTHARNVDFVRGIGAAR